MERVCFDCIYKFCLTVSYYKRNERDKMENVYLSSCIVPVILVKIF